MPKKKSYEEAVAELEALVEALESGELPLEQAIRAYEKGIALKKLLEGLLSDAQRRVTMLAPDGREKPFGETYADEDNEEEGSEHEDI